MKIKTLNLLALLFYITFLNAQEPTPELLEQKYVDYFKLEPETIYTHLNKTKYLHTEELWFKSYLYNTKTQKPYLTTTNVYVSIYNDLGELIDKRLFYAEDGMTYGNIKLSKYYPGLYYIKVSTNYMRNFKEQLYSLQQFEVVGEGSPNSSTLVLDRKYDFQLLPESGHLLNNAINTIGFKTLDQQGNSVIIESATVYDSQRNVITTFKSNRFGMGKFSLLINNTESYTIEATSSDGSIIKKVIPKPEVNGITLNINNLNPNTLFVSISTNAVTLPNLLNKTYYLVIHRDGLLKKIELTFDGNKLDYLIPIPKQELLSGMNILTVFNDQIKPVSERLVYNYTPNLHNSLELHRIEKGLDSTTILLKTNIKYSIQKNISISVLPESTKSYTSKKNILSRFLLEPYIKGEIENPQYYFVGYNRKKAVDLDILMLTQGWSSYSWHSIFNKPIKALHHFESGMQIKGKVNNTGYKKGQEIVLYSQESELILTTKLGNDDYFSFENVFLINGTSIYFSQKGKKGNVTKPVVYVNMFPNLVEDKLTVYDLRNSNYQYDKTIFNEAFSFNNTTVLDTVSLKEDRESKPRNQINRGSFNTNKINIEERYDPFAVVTDVIRDNGFDVINTGTEVQILSRRATGFSGRTQPNIYIDNRPLTSGEIIELTFLRLEQVDEIYISRTAAAGLGNRGGNINIFTKKSFSSTRQKLSFSENKVGFGFTLPDDYYAPYYNKTFHLTYSEYGVLNWLPNLRMSEDGVFTFKIPNYTFEGITFFIEGIASDGSLISKIETIKL